MKKKILIPTDFSKNAWNAVTYAADLFKDQECTFYLVNSYVIDGYPIGDINAAEFGETSFDKARKISGDGLNKILEMLKLRNTNYDHNYNILTEYGDPISVIKSVIDKNDIDLVVMGTKGENNRSGALFGSNTITAMDEVRNCPVMSVPLEAIPKEIKEIVFPTSYSSNYKSRELLHLVQIAIAYNANICVLHVSPEDSLSETKERNKQMLSECLEGANYSFHHISGSKRNLAVRNFVESRDSDMIAMVNRKHAFFEKIFATPMLKELGMFSHVPLLAMHDLHN
ncbi:universal stress protein [Nonlabens antarcticus]|uniref:universal stress protein n=1 Tax=Nonlabens antarcticus TaxID=392714 RepID=UPI001891CB63|nr:universal stress protein [Nonlabens antarcticus]